jgi:hypothetical protein
MDHVRSRNAAHVRSRNAARALDSRSRFPERHAHAAALTTRLVTDVPPRVDVPLADEGAHDGEALTLLHDVRQAVDSASSGG